jgi:uncharacterized protein (UPF0147 family)|tara:strand:- start:572 stop:820 length:249 start_codon:yes stop_codon:yes gene_type:complete
MLKNELLSEILVLMRELEQDTGISNITKEKIVNSIETLNGDLDLSVRASKVIHEIEEVSQKNNIESYTRTQLWNIVSLLEKL